MELLREIMDAGFGKQAMCPFLEQVRQKGLSITSRRLKVSLVGGPRTLKRGSETPEATGAGLLLMGP